MKANTAVYRTAVGLAIGTMVILFWLIGAVGVIGAEGNPADRMYLGVLAVGILGAAIARRRPMGMAWALVAVALAQASVAVIAMINGEHRAEVTSIFEISALNGFFVVLWVASALLFRKAARDVSGAKAM